MSNATFRHMNGLSMKHEILREIKHWKHSCTKCINDVTSNIRSLRESRALVKSEINATRAQLEERLRELELRSETQMWEIVEMEEDKMKRFVKKLRDRQRRLEMTESVLKENVIGFKLKRTIEDGKHQTLAVREAMLEVRKSDMAEAVDFKLKEQLYSITELLDSLGTVTLITSHRHQQSMKESENSNNLETNMSDKGIGASVNSVRDCKRMKGDTRLESIEQNKINELKFIMELDTKYGHSLKPFLDSVKDLSFSYNHQVTTETKPSAHLKNSQTILKCVQMPKSVLRPQSARTGGIDGPKIRMRLSKSAREEGRNQLEGNICLNDVDMAYVPFEEQGPESKATKKRSLTVRYHDFDLVKEITTINDNPGAAPNNDMVITNSLISSDGKVQDLVRLPIVGPYGTSMLSSVSYKPFSPLASGPVHITPSELRNSMSFFKYTSRFHTKKHPYETDLCRLTNILALDNGQIVVSDINHLQVMLFGPDYTYLDALECPSPCGLCHVSENTIAVTLFHNRKILLVKVHTIHLIRHKELHVPCKQTLYAVCFREGRYFVLCFAGDIHVLDDDGRQIMAIQSGIDAGQARNMDIHVDGDAKMIFVSGHDRVSCFNESGKKLWQYTCSTHHRRFSPGGVVLHNDRLFVADWSSHKVLELTLDGSYVRDVVVDNIQYPHALAVQRSYGKLFITQSNFFKQEARSRSVKVFNIK